MNAKDVQERIERLREGIDANDLSRCLHEINVIEAADTNAAIFLSIAEIEVGCHFRRVQNIESGLDRVDSLLRDEGLGPSQREALEYNRTVGLQTLCDLEADIAGRVTCRRELIRQLSQLEQTTNQTNLRLQIAVNLGNAYSALGRRMEAIEAWNRALAIDPDFGMARGNRGIELIHYADLGAHHGLDIAEGYSDLQAALDDKRTVETGGLAAVKRFERERNRNQDHAAGHAAELQVALKLPAESRQSRFPFLNTCAHSWRCDYRFTDAALFRSAVFPLSDEARQERMFHLVNAFKENFATARYMFENSSSLPETLDEKTKYIFLTDYSVWGVKYGLMKQCIVQLISGLDKLAGVLNEYFALGVHPQRTYFLSLFEAGGRNLSNAESERVAAVPGFSSANTALKSVALDLADIEPLKRLVELRHGATHRAVTVHVAGVEPSGNRVEEYELEETVLQTARIARYSFLYAMDAVATSSRHGASSGLTVQSPLETTWDEKIV